MRPRFVCERALAVLRLRPLSRAGLARELQLSYAAAHNTLSYLERTGEVCVVGTQSTGTKPAAVYAPAAAEQPVATRGAELHFFMGVAIASGRGRR